MPFVACLNLPQPIKILGCTHCCTTEENLASLSKGVREASSEAVQNLAYNAMSTVGTAKEFKYFLPRILHEMYLDKVFSDLTIGKLTQDIKQAGYDVWVDDEKQAVQTGLVLIFEKHCGELSDIELIYWLHDMACVDFELS